MKGLMFAAAVAVACFALAEEAAPKAKMTKEERLARVRQRQLARTGGLVTKAGSGSGEFVFVNQQKLVDLNQFAPAFRKLGDAFNINLFIRDKANEKLPRVYVTESDSDPALLVAPEDRWAKVNVRALAKDAADAKALAKRVRCEMIRAFALACGGCNSQYPTGLNGPITVARELDVVADEELAPDVEMRLTANLPYLGITPYTRKTYLAACHEGWAPQPTNEYQKAIWDKLHELPTKPITIEPESKAKTQKK